MTEFHEPETPIDDLINSTARVSLRHALPGWPFTPLVNQAVETIAPRSRRWRVEKALKEVGDIMDEKVSDLTPTQWYFTTDDEFPPDDVPHVLGSACACVSCRRLAAEVFRGESEQYWRARIAAENPPPPPEPPPPPPPPKLPTYSP